MRLHGTPRESDDIDFCVKGPSRPELCRAMHLDERFVLPQTKLFVSAFGFYLHTGPALGDNECEEDMIIRIEFLLEGLHPPRLWKEVQEMQYPDRDRKLRVLSRGYMLRSKIRTFAQREAEKDFEDVGYLLSQGIDEGYAIVLE